MALKVPPKIGGVKTPYVVIGLAAAGAYLWWRHQQGTTAADPTTGGGTRTVTRTVFRRVRGPSHVVHRPAPCRPPRHGCPKGTRWHQAQCRCVDIRRR